jgi:hypothetical protein
VCRFALKRAENSLKEATNNVVIYFKVVASTTTSKIYNVYINSLQTYKSISAARGNV